MRRLYAERRETLAAMLRETFDGRLMVGNQRGGTHLLLRPAEGAYDVHISGLAADAGLCVHPLSLTYRGRARRCGIMLGFANVPERRARRLSRRLDRAIAAGLWPPPT